MRTTKGVSRTMELSLECIINDSIIAETVNPGIVLLDFLRRHEHLTGTKEGCREGDCGACTVLLGELRGSEVVYTSVNSCLLPLADVQGKHVVTIEGINQPAELTPIQQAIVDEGGTQCGFCTPGFILSLTGYCMKDAQTHAKREAAQASGDSAAAGESAANISGVISSAAAAILAIGEADTIAAADTTAISANETDAISRADAKASTTVDGNVCRCTGHAPIKKAIRRINEYLSLHPNTGGSPISHLVGQKILPDYFQTIPSRLGELQKRGTPEQPFDETVGETAPYIVSGGTDLYVQKAFTMHAEPVLRIPSHYQRAKISESDDAIHIPGTTTVEDFRSSPLIEKYFPGLASDLLLFGSTPIRNRATIGGNLANASPIADMACLFMALNADLTLQENDVTRTLALRKFYTGYKQLAKKRTELIAMISVAKPGPASHLSYEKVSRRKYLDIASVNSAMIFDLHDGTLSNVGISAGGVGPTMLHLAKTSAYLNDTPMDALLFAKAWTIASAEISPISDARGSADYKRLLLRQLLAAHIMRCFPGMVKKEALA